MANQAVMPPNHPGVPVAQEQRDHRLYLLGAACPLLLFGAAVAVSAVGNPDADADAGQVFLGLVTLLLGVCLLSLLPVAGRFPQADAFAGVAIANANAVFRHIIMFTPWN
ncbi:unnamed protein product [Urochloa humidicola]